MIKAKLRSRIISFKNQIKSYVMNIFNQKQYPHAVTLKSTLLMVVLVAMGIIISLIFYNVFHSIHKIKHADSFAEKSVSIKSLSTAVDVNWYKNAQSKKSISVIKPASATTTQTIHEDDLSQNKVVAAVSEDLQKAMAAPISSNQITGEQNSQVAQLSQTSSSPDAVLSSGMPTAQSQTPDQNLQAEKQIFLQAQQIKSEENYLHHTLKNPISRYEIKAGTIIPSLLISGINSDLPGQITAQVRSPVYDTTTGRYLLIPQGAKLIGVYDSQIAYGQERLLVAWKRIILPNGKSLDLEGMPGVDVSGYAGFNDAVNHHYRKIFGSVLLMSVLGAGAQLSQPQQNNNGNNGNNNQLSVGQIIAQSVGTNIANAGTMILQKNINIQPTLEIQPGYLFNITVTKDMVFPNAYEVT